jgi:uncharacterized YigZ family protein
MLFNDTYKSVGGISEGAFSDKGSKFIAHIQPFASELELKHIISKVKSSHPKASHYCWAFRLSTDRSVFRVNDDGEPSGTAGRPILNVLLSNDLTNVIVVVARYFGGTLLGVPGLINAYKKASLEAVHNSVIIEVVISSTYQVSFEHRQMNEVMKIIKDEEIKIQNQVFDTICLMRIELRQATQERVLDRLKKIEGLSIKFISAP